MTSTSYWLPFDFWWPTKRDPLYSSDLATPVNRRVYGVFTQYNRFSENCFVQHLKVSYDKNRIDPIGENCVVRHNLSDYVKIPLDTHQLILREQYGDNIKMLSY
jgi:hypothetical protein